MTIPPRRTGRYTDRVDLEAGPASEFSGLFRVSGPERLSSAPASSSTPERNLARTYRERVHLIGRDLTDRDRAVLRSLDRFRFLSTGQLQQLHFTHHETVASAARVCRRVLGRLAELRVVEPIERRIGGARAGSSGIVWRVGVVGDRLLHLDDEPRARRKEPSLRFLEHTMAIADVYCSLVANGIEVAHVDTEPINWRPFLTAGGVQDVVKPDLFVVTITGDYEDVWFLEVDLSTESLPTIVKQCDRYERYRRTGQEQRDGGVFPRIVWVAPDDRRAESIERAIHAAKSLDNALYRVTTMQAVPSIIAGGAA